MAPLPAVVIKTTGYQAVAGAVQHEVSPPQARQRVISVHQYKAALVQNPLQDRAIIRGHILNVRIPLLEMNAERSSKPDEGYPETVVSCELKSGWCTCSTANTWSFFWQFVCSKKQFYAFQRSSHRVHFTYTSVACSLSLLRLLMHGLPLSFGTTIMHIMLNNKKLR